jgi:predicted DCC family thiol-disulfide oxidoreductase YuxK
VTGKIKAPGEGGIILFDGVCRLCERSVQFVIRHDPFAKFIFAPLQSDYAHGLIEELGLSMKELFDGDLNSFVLIANGTLSLRSDAWLSICGQLDGWPSLLRVFRIVPHFIRDAVYDFIGRHRYQWFGKNSECVIPTPDIQQRFMH